MITNFEEETTDFDQEVGNIFRALIQNELNNDKNGLYANNINEISKIQQMIKRNDSFQSLINSQQNIDDLQRITDDNQQVPPIGGQA